MNRVIRPLIIEMLGHSSEVNITFGVLKKIEDRISIPKYLGDVQYYKANISDTAWVIYSAVGSEYKLTYDDVGEFCIDNLEKANVIAMEIIAKLISPKSDKKKEPEVQKEKKRKK
jgi:hypothetical protein